MILRDRERSSALRATLRLTVGAGLSPAEGSVKPTAGFTAMEFLPHALLLSSGASIPAFAADSTTADRNIPCAIVDSSRSARAAYTFILTSCADLSSGAAATAQSAR